MIVIVTTSAMILIRTSLTGNQVIGEKVIALNLALEGIEAVKNMRDTNYLNFSSDPDNCWDKLDVADVADCSDGTADEIDETATYYLERDFYTRDLSAFGWRMVMATDFDRDGEDGQLSLYECDACSEAFQLYARSGLRSGTGFVVADDTNEDVFQRLLTFEYDASGDSFDVTVTVYWTVGEVEKSISLTRTIANVY